MVFNSIGQAHQMFVFKEKNEKTEAKPEFIY